MQGAIVCFSMQNYVFRRWRKPVLEKLPLPIGDGEVFIFTLPYTETQFFRLERKRQKTIICRCAQYMEKMGVACVYPEASLYNHFEGKFYIPDGRRIFSACAGQIIERHIQAFNLYAEETEVFIFETPFTQNGIVVAEFMAMRSKKLHLVSADKDSLRRAANVLFEECGIMVAMESSEKLMNKADIVLLLTSPSQEVLSSGLVLDYSGAYPYRARKDLQFEIDFGFVRFLQYFGRTDCRSAEFMLCCCDLESAENLDVALREIGWRVRCV